jgi:hypothetical protein
MQTTDDEKSLFFIQFDLITGTRIGKGCIKPFVEWFDRVENFGNNEIEEGPEFREVILKRRTG